MRRRGGKAEATRREPPGQWQRMSCSPRAEFCHDHSGNGSHFAVVAGQSGVSVITSNRPLPRRRNEGAGKREIPEKTRRPTASSGTIPTCENPVTRPGFEPVRLLSFHQGGVRLPACSPPDFPMCKSCPMMSLVIRFSQGSPVSPPLHSATTPYSSRFTLISSQLQHCVISTTRAGCHRWILSDPVAMATCMRICKQLRVTPSPPLHPLVQLNMELRWNEGVGKRKSPEKTRQPTASSGTIPTCESPVTRQGLEPGSP
ncbi:hypothetical protein PR048_024734 [Dryococelus australis]|uniref:Uncharacterized protein n=1 Tax=Dryococelus australis TaxID=614101 RepID=A0ABQ9GPF9_9NEOP|nr:hypothetical protein PR048_024734 [Dryococelus australis]